MPPVGLVPDLVHRRLVERQRQLVAKTLEQALIGERTGPPRHEQQEPQRDAGSRQRDSGHPGLSTERRRDRLCPPVGGELAAATEEVKLRRDHP